MSISLYSAPFDVVPKPADQSLLVHSRKQNRRMGFCQGLFGFEDRKGYEYGIREGLGLVGENHLESKLVIIPGIDIEFHRDGLTGRDGHLPGNSGERLGIFVVRRWIGLKHYGPCDRDFGHAGNGGVKHEFVSLV